MVKYVINLDKDTERLDFQKSQLGTFERISAKTTGDVSAFRWWCAVLRPRVEGELGCAESHKESWSRFLSTNEKSAAIFEDDALLADGFETVVDKAVSFVASNPRAVVLLADHRESKHGRIAEVPRGEASVKIERTEWDHCSEAYVIGREAASMLLEKQTPIRVPLDWWGYYQHKGWIELFRVNPPISSQQETEFVSNLGSRYDVSKEPRISKRLWWKARRIVGAAIDAFLDGKAGW